MLVPRAGDTFILITLHVLYGQSPTQRVGELQAIARWLADWAGNVNAYHHKLIVLGDFNIDRKDDPLYQAFTSTGLTVPDALHEVPRTIFGSSTTHHYDQIAWFASGIGRIPKLSLKPTGAAGSFDFTGLVHRQLTRQTASSTPVSRVAFAMMVGKHTTAKDRLNHF